ncbi:uncharacterized protein LOC115240788 [Formica exsecta]|uniref:uncharacterized protein LOC115240788 n=1 Tax=Formica exsecta TaxID=72781 RepID=UPI001141696A|nr:uncharacterized protein LOC115240788 [Formica exsecta]
MVRISFSEKKTDRFSEFLACASNNVMNKYLELIMFKENEDLSKIGIKRRINSFLFIIAKHAKHYNVLSNILRNFDKLKPRSINGIAIFIVIVNHVYSKRQLDEIGENTRNIIEIEAYINHIKHIYKKNRTRFDKAIINAHFHEYKDLVEQWVLYAERKLQMRLSEIERQISYLHNFSQ